MHWRYSFIHWLLRITKLLRLQAVQLQRYRPQLLHVRAGHPGVRPGPRPHTAGPDRAQAVRPCCPAGQAPVLHSLAVQSGASPGRDWVRKAARSSACPSAAELASASFDLASGSAGLGFSGRQVVDRAGPAAADRRGVRGGRGHDQLRRRAGQDDARADHLAAAAAGAAVRRQRAPGDRGAARR